MKIRDSAVWIAFDAFPYAPPDGFRALVVQENSGGCAQKADGPSGDKKCAGNAHQRVHPDQAKIFTGEQGKNREYRCKGIRKDMQVCGPEVMVVLMVFTRIVKPIGM